MTTETGTTEHEEQPREEAQAPAAAPSATDAAPAAAPAAEEHEQSTSTRYELQLPEGLPATELPHDYAEHLAGFNEVAVSAGITQRDAQRLLNAFVDSSLDMRADVDLTSAWAAGDAERFLRGHGRTDYDRQMALCRRGIDKLGGDKLRAWLNESGYGNSPAVIEALARYGAGELSVSKEEAQKKLDLIVGDRKHAYWNPNTDAAERKRLTAQVRFLSDVAREDDSPRPATGTTMDAGYLTHKRAHGANPRAEAQRMLADKSSPLNNSNDPGHAAAVKKFHELTARLL